MEHYTNEKISSQSYWVLMGPGIQSEMSRSNERHSLYSSCRMGTRSMHAIINHRIDVAITTDSIALNRCQTFVLWQSKLRLINSAGSAIHPCAGSQRTVRAFGPDRLQDRGATAPRPAAGISGRRRRSRTAAHRRRISRPAGRA